MLEKLEPSAEKPPVIVTVPAKRSRAPQIALLLVLALLAGFGFLLFRHFQRMERQIAELQSKLEQSQRSEEQASDLSRNALSQAFQAQQNARAADAGKAQAEDAKTQAEDAKTQAVKAADEARQSATAANEQAKVARREADEIKQRREEEIDRLQKALGKIADTERTPLGLVMTLGSESVKFDFDKADLRPAERELLSRIAGVLLTAYGFRIQVFGHTDDVGTDAYNQSLSERRANVVRDYLVQAGVSPDIMASKGFGKSSPRVRGNSPDARARNRRVEIGIVDSVIHYSGEVAQETPHR